MSRAKIRSSIHEFAKNGDIAGVLNELARGVDVNARDPATTQTPLSEAVHSSRASVELVNLLIQRGANVNESVKRPDCQSLPPNYSVLELATGSGNVEVVRALIDAGADFRYRSEAGYDALIDAVCQLAPYQDARLLPMVQLLIERGADLNTVSDYGESALKIASRVGRFDVVQLLWEAGANPDVLQWTPLMFAIALGSPGNVEEQLSRNPDLLQRDSWERTAWLLSILTGDITKAKLLLAAGANRADRGRCGQTPIAYAIEGNHPGMLRWLLDEGFDPDARDDFQGTPLMEAAEAGATECVRILLEGGADINCEKHGETAIANAANVEIVRLLIDRGANLADLGNDARAKLTKLPNDGKFSVSHEEYLEASTRRFGVANPEKMNVPFWRNMVTNGLCAYAAREEFGEGKCPVWCFKRFGKSLTELPDGRIIEIAGEHEDFYDEDFCIYNDAIVHHGDGRFDMYGYPSEIFPPTDFHTATLVGNFIYIIGSLGYQGKRALGDTPVYRLHTDSLAVEKVETTGNKPGWISRHNANYDGEKTISVWGGKLCVMRNGKEEYEDNPGRFSLDLQTFVWIASAEAMSP